jgi:hypothetical protein
MPPVRPACKRNQLLRHAEDSSDESSEDDNQHVHNMPPVRPVCIRNQLHIAKRGLLAGSHATKQTTAPSWPSTHPRTL